MLQIKNMLGGGKPEGLYAWSKYSVLDVLLEKYISSTEQQKNMLPYSSSNVLYKSSSYTFDKTTGVYTLVNPSSVSGSTLSDAVHMYSGEYFMLNAMSGATMYKAPTHTSQNYAVTVYNNTANGFGMQTYGNYGRAPYYIYSNESGIERTFISCVVANDESAYPNGAVHTDGYYYEKCVDLSALGMTKYETGSFTLSSDDYTVTFNHTLGEKPKAVIINENSSITDSNYVNTYLAPSSYGAYVYSNRVSGNSASGNTLNESTVTVTTGNTSRKFKAGVKYNYVLLA